MSTLIGSKLGRYEIRSKLGAGAVGDVYLAQDLSVHRSVAIKVLSTELTANKDRLRCFEREAFAASSLNHPNILTVYEVGHENEDHFLVTEFIDGESIGRRLEREGFELPEILEIGMQIASALAAAHAAGMVHRDIKPDNIMLRQDHLVKVVDFGLAKFNQQEISVVDTEVMTKIMPLPDPGAVMGTARYMSPEQARGLSVDARTDTWSLGVVLYEMATGHLPFTGPTMSDVIASILNEAPPLLSRYAPETPAELERILTKALRKDVAERYQNAKDLGLDLKALKEKLELEAELPHSRKKAKPTSATQGTARKTSRIAAAPHDNELTLVRPAGKIKRQNRATFLMLATIVFAVIAVGYFAYLRYGRVHRAGITSLAVLPFVNSSKDPEKEYLADGISESLINVLSQLPGVKVIANTSSIKYKGKNVDPQDVARALGVAAILAGRVTQQDDNVSIRVELIDASDRTQLWGEQYDRKVTDLIAVQADISQQIARKLQLRLTEGQQKIATPEKVNPRAYELLLKGRLSRSRGGTTDRKKAAEYFTEAISVDSGYAPAYAELAITYWSLVNSSALDPKEFSPKAEALAQKALQLDENLAEGYYALANLKTDAWEWTDAEAKYKRALELNPNLALARRWYANFLTLMGRHEQAIAEIKRAQQLDPLSLPINAIVGYTFYQARQYDQAIEALNKTLEMDRNFPYAHLFSGYTYAAKGMFPAAIAEYQEAIKLGQNTPSRQISLGAAYARSGDRNRAQAILIRLQTSQEYVSPGELAVLYGALGERDQAFASLEKAYNAHDLQLQYLRVSPAFDPLRSDPRFQDLLLRVGLAP